MPNPYRQFLLDQVDRSKVFQRFVERGLENDEYALFHGLEGGARALVVARLQQRLARPVLVVAADAETAEGWYDDLQHFGVEGLEYFPMGGGDRGTPVLDSPLPLARRTRRSDQGPGRK